MRPAITFLNIQLSNSRIDYIQGYYFSKPIPEKEFLKFIRERNAF